MINDVTDTALWVAHLRGQETELFQDPLATFLAGERGKEIAKHMSYLKYTAWMMVIRTYIIDRYIEERIKEGVDTVVNLGCGLDTRPYRMNIKARWVEVDFPQMIALKEEKLNNEKPNGELLRFAVDLSDDEKRKELLSKISGMSQNILVITEGVIPYLSENQVANLAKDLLSFESFKYWVVDYYNIKAMKNFWTKKRKKQMKNAPIQFFPENWEKFFLDHGWKIKVLKYLGEEGIKLNRNFPIPWWMYIAGIFMSKSKKEAFKTLHGYGLLERIK